MTNNKAQLILTALNEYWRHSPDIVVIKDLEGRYVGASQEFVAMTGRSSLSELIGKTDLETYDDPALARRYMDDDARLLAGDSQGLLNFIEPLPPRDGMPRYCLTSKYILRDEEGSPVGTLGVARDITNEYLAKQSYDNELQTLFDLPPDTPAAVLFDITSWRVVDARFRDDYEPVMSRFSLIEEYLENAANSVVEDEQARRFFLELTREYVQEQYNSGRRGLSLEYLRRMPGGEERWVRNDLHLLLDPITGNLSLIILLRDIDAAKREYTQLVLAAEQDTMTELLNRHTMVKRIEHFLVNEGAGRLHALFMIDVDDFKQINDSFGHQYGDSVLKATAKAIRHVFRSNDLIARMGGDEFMVLMTNVESPLAVRRKAEALTAELQFFSRTFDKELEVSSSVGVTVFRGGEDDFPTLYDQADSALYQAKDKGKTCFSIFGMNGPLQNGAAEEEQRADVDTVHLRTLLEYMDGGVILMEVSDDIRVTYVSPSLLRSFDRTQQELSSGGRSILDLIVPEDLPQVRSALFHTAHSNELLDHSYRVVSDKGTQWRHLRAKRIPEDRGDGVQRIVSVLTDVSQLKSTEENLRETELRYRTAVEQTDTMLWEVDIARRSLTLTGPAWKILGNEQGCFPNAPETYLQTGRIHPDSVAEFRQMFQDIYKGNHGRNYYFKAIDAQGKELWVSANFTLLRDNKGQPYCALGVTTQVANINAEMRRFEQETRFADIVSGSLMGSICANFTQNLLVMARMEGDPRYARMEGMDYDNYHKIVSTSLVYEEDVPHFDYLTSRRHLLERFNQGENWKFVDYRRLGQDGTCRWTSLFIKLMRHPISGDVYAFAYLRDNDVPRRWELELGQPLQRNATLLLYSPGSMAALGRHIITTAPAGSMVAVSVIELVGLDRVRSVRGELEASELLFTFGRLCRIAIAGDAIIGQLDENRVVVLRQDAISADHQHEAVTHTLNLLKELMSQAHPEARINLTGGFAVEQASLTSYDLLLRKAEVACRSAAQTLGVSAVAYAETGLQAPDERNAFDLATSYKALELRYQQQVNLLKVSENDDLTGLLGKAAFYRNVRQLLDSDSEGSYAIIRLDVNRFKVFNDVRGMGAGDRLLRDLAAHLRQHPGPSLFAARLESDHFVLLTPDNEAAIKRSQKRLTQWLTDYSPDFRLSCTIGVYRINDPGVEVSMMCDRALLALRAAKSGFETRVGYYDETLRGQLLEEQQLIDDLSAALNSGQFELYFQPQVNYDDGSLIGAEALVRWNHPSRGLLSPAAFIPLFEKNGLITQLDFYVWDCCCRQIRDWIDRYPQALNLAVSVNVSRLDIYDNQLCSLLLSIVSRYHLPASALKLEITESAYMENPQQLIDTVYQLRQAGFTVEMDDFGSGYSSLNTLKDVVVDTLKLDMNFLADCADSSRGGNILSSIIRMAHWLKLPVIAEGVETKEQADYLKSLGCVYMQGFYFATPMPADRFEQMLTDSGSARADRYSSVNLEGVAAFWDSSAQTALLFNSFVGGAAILEYENGNVAIIRANDRFYAEINTTRSDYLHKQQRTLERFQPEYAALFTAMLEEAISSGDEAECDILSLPQQEGGRRFWTHNRVRPLAKNGDVWLFYMATENITARKDLEAEQEAETERNRLLMETTGAVFVDYDYVSDVLDFQLYIAGEGAVNRRIEHCTPLFFERLLHPDSREPFRAAIMAEDGPGFGELEFRAEFWSTGWRWYRLRYVKVRDEGGRVYRLVGQSDDIHTAKEREALAEAVSRRLNASDYGLVYNDVVINQVFSLFYESEDIVASIKTTLAMLGEYFDLSRAYVFEDVDEHRAVSNTFEWCAPGVEPQQEWLQAMDYDEIGGRQQYMSQFNTAGAFFCPDVSQLGPELRAVLEPQGIVSMLQSAIRDNGVFTGFIGFDECRGPRRWTDEQAGTLMFVSRIIGSFLVKLRSSDSAAFSADFRAALDDNSAFVYIIDPQSFEIIYSNRAIWERFGRDYIGQTCFREFAGQDQPCAQCPVHHLYDSPGPHIAEVLWPHGMQVLTHISPLHWNGREMAMVSCIDITESQRAKEELITEKQKTDLAISAAQLTLWTYDLRDDSFLVSKSTQEQYHVSRRIENCFQKDIDTGRVQADSVDAYLDLHRRMKEGAATASAVIHLDPAQCDAEWKRITYTAIKDAFGQVNTAVGIGQDVTAQKQAEERYRQEAEYRKSLGSDCLLTMRINVSRDLLEDVQTSTPEEVSFQPGMSRDQLVPAFADRISDPTERDAFLSFFTPEHLLTAFELEERELRLNYRSLGADGQPCFRQADVRLAQRPGDRDVIAFVAFRDRTMAALTQGVMARLVQTGYDYIAYIDVTSKAYRLLAADPGNQTIPPAAGADFDATVEMMLTRYGAEGELERLRDQVRLERVREALAEQGEYTCTYHSSPQFGSRLWQLVFRPLSDDHQQLMLTRQDVTALVEAEHRVSQQLAEALAAAEEANAAKSDFLSRISHDIRTPLNAVIGLTTLALDQPNLPAAVAEYLRVIDNSGRYLQSLISDILDMSKIERRLVELRPTRYEYAEFLATIEAVFLPLCQQKGLTLRLEGQEKGLALLVDKVRFNQIIFNILANAVNFTPAGGYVRYAEENLRLENGLLSCDYVVSDNGCGIGADFLPHVFEPFSQECRDPAALNSGNGLGLAIAHSLVQLMGGSISITSQPGQGTEVRVHLVLPLDQSPSADAPESRDARQALLSNPELFAGARMLLAEDVPVNTEIVKGLLERAGASVVCVENGREAVAAFAAADCCYFDAVLLDIFMPELDGLEACRQIRSLNRADAALTPVVALSANAFAEDLELSQAAGMNAHLPKPINAALLYQTLSRLMAQAQQQKAEARG